MLDNNPASEEVPGQPPCFSDASCRREVTRDPYGQTGRSHSWAGDLRCWLKITPNFSYAGGGGACRVSRQALQNNASKRHAERLRRSAACSVCSIETQR